MLGKFAHILIVIGIDAVHALDASIASSPDQAMHKQGAQPLALPLIADADSAFATEPVWACAVPRDADFLGLRTVAIGRNVSNPMYQFRPSELPEKFRAWRSNRAQEAVMT